MAINKTEPYQACPCGSGKKYKFCCHAKQQSAGHEHPLTLLKNAAQYPVCACRINESWQWEGLATLIIVRQLPNSKVIFGSYLIDTLCLGLKNTFFNANVTYSSIEALLSKSPVEMIAIDYEDARSIIFGGIEYAAGLGFEPDSDWEECKHIVEPERPFEPKFEFGKNGQPLYMQGPNDDPDKILAMLNKKAKKADRSLWEQS